MHWLLTKNRRMVNTLNKLFKVFIDRKIDLNLKNTVFSIENNEEMERRRKSSSLLLKSEIYNLIKSKIKLI